MRTLIAAAAMILAPLLSATAVRIMPLGDSITEGDYYSNYRLYLERLLRAHGVDVDFVGTLHWGADSLQDADMEGHNGYTVDQIRYGIERWLDSTGPEIVLLMIGTNDMWGDPAATAGRLDSLLGEMFAHLPGLRVFVSSIPPMSYSDANVQAYNARIPGIVDAQAELGRAISFVDIYSLLTTDDLADGVHPNDTGHQKVAQGWYEAIGGVLDSMGTGASRLDMRVFRTVPCPGLQFSVYDAAGRCLPAARAIRRPFVSMRPSQVESRLVPAGLHISSD